MSAQKSLEDRIAEFAEGTSSIDEVVAQLQLIAEGEFEGVPNPKQFVTTTVEDAAAALSFLRQPILRATTCELPMIAFDDRLPLRDELMGEQTLLVHTPVGTWDIEFYEAGQPFPERWFRKGAHWLDISAMWPGVTLQVTAFFNRPALEVEA